MMKKLILPMILAFCLLLSGCGKQETAVETTSGTTQETEVETNAAEETEEETEPAEETEEAEESEEETDAAEETEAVTDSAEETAEVSQNPSTEYDVTGSAAANAEVDYYTAYQSVFEAYETIFDGKWMAEDYLTNGFPTQLIYCMGNTPYENIGYTLLDLDNDGVQELLIGEASADPFYDCILLQMYTLEDGKVVKVLSSEESAFYQLCEDSTIALNGGSAHYAYSNGALNEVSSDSPAQELSYSAFSFYEDFIKE
jgi:hypothetical protein